uniref:Trafficking protein particle complex subunit n=1 Tax=Panagrolaimus sp. JU765 TaxID=591449 RepID=A0AC34R932_9BILA
MSIYHIFIINRAGSLIFEWENKPDDSIKIEKTFSYPLDIIVEMVDQKPTVVFGERDGIRVKYIISAVNGQPIRGMKFENDTTGKEEDFFEFIDNEENYPVHLSFVPPVRSANDKIVLASTFHSLHAIAVQLSPVIKSSGIKLLETSQFRLHCFQSLTGIKFIVVASTSSPPNLDAFLKKIYEIYSDFALKNPFYSIDMPIRADKFDEALKQLIEKQEKSNIVTL